MDNHDLPDQLKHLIDVVNLGDSEAFIAFFPVDGVVNDWGTRYVGRAAIRSWSDREFVGAKVTLTVISSEQQNDGISILAKVGGNGFNGPSRFTFLLRSGNIQEMKITEN